MPRAQEVRPQGTSEGQTLRGGQEANLGVPDGPITTQQPGAVGSISGWLGLRCGPPGRVCSGAPGLVTQWTEAGELAQTSPSHLLARTLPNPGSMGGRLPGGVQNGQLY